MRKIDAKIMAETQKIRHYIMNLLYRSAGRQTMIPSSRELAVQFGVSRTTVRVVLEKLTAEEYLVVKRGIGTFTNPFALQPGCFGKEALIGLKSGHGDSFFYAPPEARAVAFMLETAAECGFNSRLLSAGCDDEREAKVAPINSHVDGVLCYNTQPWFTRSAAALLPTVLLYNREAGVPCVMFDGNLAACQLLAMLQQSQIHTVGWDGMPDQLYHLQIRNFLESSGIRNLDLPLRSMGSALEYLTDFCTMEKIGCVICDGGFSPVLQAIEQRSGKLFLKIFMTRSLHPGTNAWLLSTDVRGACATACRMLKDLLNGKPVSDQISNLELVSLAQ